MRSSHLSRRRMAAFLFSLALAIPLVIGTGGAALAADPISGSISPTGPTVEWDGTAPGGVAPTGEETCTEGLTCDTFALTVSGTQGAWNGKQIRIGITWLSPSTDYDLNIHKGGPGGPIVASSGNGTTTFESAAIFPSVSGTGLYSVTAVYFAATAADQYHGTAAVEVASDIQPAPQGASAPRFQNYVAPPAMGNSAGEPTLGVNTVTGNVMYIAGLETLRVSFDDCSSPAKATWTDVSDPTTSTASLDPILFTLPQTPGPDPTCRTFVSQLLGGTSATSYTDDDGETYTPTQGGGLGSGVDHQNIGGGRFADPAPVHTYPYSVYYCAQGSAEAACALSVNGGLTFGPAIPMYTSTQCGGLHGHIKVAPNDGTAYVPNKGCPGFGNKQAVVRSTDNGLNWTILPIPDSTAGDWDPSVDVGRNGTVYFGYSDGSGRAQIAISTNRGQGWTPSVDVGAAFGIREIAFPAVVAGDDGRAAFAFLGTPSAPGSPDAIWHLYVATTYDGGAHWRTVDATPNDPVQRGTICSGGISCGNDRNLLDFMDAVIDARGRILVGYADGCVDACVQGPPNSFTAKATIARQSGGRGLLAASDTAQPTVPAAPRVTATRDQDGIHLSWPVPDSGGSPITSYSISRSTSASGGFSEIATTQNPKYDDAAVLDGTAYFYRVRARNAVGTGPACQVRVGPNTTVAESPCTAPGLTIIEDAEGDALDTLAQHDIRRASVAEPYFIDGSQKVVFTLKMSDLSAPLSPNTFWPVYFTTADGQGHYVEMQTNPAGTPSFKYGLVAVDDTATDGYGTKDPPAGDLAAGSGYATDGTITLIAPRTAIGNPAIGQKLTRFLVRIQVGVGATGVTPDNAPDSLGPVGSYTIKGNAFCRPNRAPTAALTASPQEGVAPLLVHFSGANSTDPDTDDIRRFRFDFGDGSPLVTQTNDATVDHTYSEPGEYRAKLTVEDDRGATSGNTSTRDIDVEEEEGGDEPALRISDRTAAEGNSGRTSFTFTVTRSGDTGGSSSVHYRTQAQTASAGSDFEAINDAVLEFAPGQTSRTLTVRVVGDTTNEPDETFLVVLSQPMDATISDDRGKGTITNDDGGGGQKPSISINDVTVTETDSTSYAVFTISLDRASDQTVTVDFRTHNGSATAGADYGGRSGTRSFSPGQLTKNVRVAIFGENVREDTETYYLDLANPTRATIADSRGVGRIRDDDPDDPAVLLTKSGPPTAVAGTNFTYTISYTNGGPLASRNARVVDVLPAGLTFRSASDGAIYDQATGTIRWSLGIVDVGESGTLTLSVHLRSTVPSGAIVSNHAEFRGDGTVAVSADAVTIAQ